MGAITHAETRLGLGNGARRLRLKPSRKLLGRAGKLTLLVVATDRNGNERELRRSLRVTRG